MKTLLRKLMAILATVAFGSLLVPMASAGCANANNGVKVAPQSWNGQSSFGSAALLLASAHDSDASIVGIWHVAFIAKGNVGPGLPPDGALVDNSFSRWHRGAGLIARPANRRRMYGCVGEGWRVALSAQSLRHLLRPDNRSQQPAGVCRHPSGHLLESGRDNLQRALHHPAVRPVWKPSDRNQGLTAWIPCQPAHNGGRSSESKLRAWGQIDSGTVAAERRPRCRIDLVMNEVVCTILCAKPEMAQVDCAGPLQLLRGTRETSTAWAYSGIG